MSLLGQSLQSSSLLQELVKRFNLTEKQQEWLDYFSKYSAQAQAQLLSLQADSILVVLTEEVVRHCLIEHSASTYDTQFADRIALAKLINQRLQNVRITHETDQIDFTQVKGLEQLNADAPESIQSFVAQLFVKSAATGKTIIPTITNRCDKGNIEHFNQARKQTRAARDEYEVTINNLIKKQEEELNQLRKQANSIVAKLTREHRSIEIQRHKDAKDELHQDHAQSAIPTSRLMELTIQKTL